MGSSADTAWKRRLLCLALLQDPAVEGDPEIHGLVFSVWVESALDIAHVFSPADELLVVERTVDHVDDNVLPSRSALVGDMGSVFRTIESGVEGCCKAAVLFYLAFEADGERDCFGCFVVDDD